jgi:hypothetical protein
MSWSVSPRWLARKQRHKPRLETRVAQNFGSEKHIEEAIQWTKQIKSK